MVICLERGADLHTAQLMPLPLTVSGFSKIQIGFTFLVPAHLGSPRIEPLNGFVFCTYNNTHTHLFNGPLDVPATWHTPMGDHVFAVACPHAWNNLPVMIHCSSLLAIFKRYLKTHFYIQYFHAHGFFVLIFHCMFLDSVSWRSVQCPWSDL